MDAIEKNRLDRLQALARATGTAKQLVTALEERMAQETGKDGISRMPARISLPDIQDVTEKARLALDRINRGSRPVGMIWREPEGTRTKYKVQFPRGIMTYCRKKDAEAVAGALAGLAQG